MLAASGLNTVLTEHPVVALDRRGIDRSTAIDCMTPEIRRGLHDLGQFDADSTGDAADAVAALGHDATIACTDYLDPQELKFGADSAAEDIDALRTRWGVETIALWSAGSGSDIALSYAAAHPNNLARLILDSPAPVATDAATEAESRVQGEEAALTAFAQRCVALRCSLGPDPKKSVTDLMERARADEFQPLSAAAVSNAISASLWTAGTNREQETRSLSDALSALGTGNASPIRRARRPGGERGGRRRPVHRTVHRRHAMAGHRACARACGHLGHQLSGVRARSRARVAGVRQLAVDRQLPPAESVEAPSPRAERSG